MPHMAASTMGSRGPGGQAVGGGSNNRGHPAGKAGDGPGYRRQMVWRVISAKRPGTQARRLTGLIDASARSERS